MDLTPSAFLAFYPQFSSFSQGVVLTEYLRQANARFFDYDEDTDEARRLYVAHKLTLYAAVCLPEGVQPSPAVSRTAHKRFYQPIASKKVGEVSVSYNTSSSVSASVSTGLADLKQTIYGLQLLSLIRMHGFAKYIP